MNNIKVFFSFLIGLILTSILLFLYLMIRYGYSNVLSINLFSTNIFTGNVSITEALFINGSTLPVAWFLISIFVSKILKADLE